MLPVLLSRARSAPKKSPKLRIAVVANAGNTNLGDEAVLASALHALRSRLVDPNIRVFSLNPADTAARHGVAAAPLRSRVTTTRPADAPTARQDTLRAAVRTVPVVAPILRACVRVARGAMRFGREVKFILRSWRRVRGADLLIVAGSNQLEDWFGGPSGYPYSVLLWTVLARLAGAPVAVISVGAGPLHSRLSQWMCVRALRFTSYASFRDAESLDLMRSLGYRGPAAVVPDLAFGLELAEPTGRPVGRQARLAINLFPFRDPQYDPTVTDGGADFAEYIDAFARLVAAAAARGMQPVVFGSQRADARALELLEQRLLTLAPDIRAVERHMPATVDELVDVIDSSDIVVATRYHGILLAVFRNRPTIGICYQSKSRRLLEMAGLGEYAIDATDLDPGVILDYLSKASTAAETGGRLSARAMAMHVDCQRGFDEALERCLPGLVIPGSVQ
jgi:polysaccharide pyruvyl transferase WcaK-like protein